MNFIDTLEGSLLEGFYPEGWDFKKIDKCCSNPADAIFDRQSFWNNDFNVVKCENIHAFDMMMGHEIAMEIKETAKAGRKLAMILPVGPMGMYKWAVYFLKEWNISAKHVFGFNMDEWSDKEGNTLAPDDPAAFQNAMKVAFYDPLGKLTIPENQRNFATRTNLPTYPEKIEKLIKEGAKLVTVFGIGRMCHIAFWEPHFAAEYKSLSEWKEQPYRIAALLHPLTIEQNAITSFKSRTTLVPCRANSIGPGLFLKSDKIIGGCDGALGRGMQWQGMSLWMTLRYGPDMWVPSSFMPTLPGKLFFLSDLAGPLEAECN
ncbi:MAG: hypothetical protein LLG13_03310 [Bacteroidales bacterium]|nr:hypothetical protein [Bacteroidales bacterium]